MRRFVGLVLLGLSLLHCSSGNPVKIKQILVTNENEVKDSDMSNNSDNKENTTTTTTTTTTPRACEDTYKSLPSGIKFLITNTVADSYKNAEDVCARDDARLISIHTDTVQKELGNIIRAEYVQFAWMGLKKTKPGIAGVGEYKWADGTVLKPGKNVSGADINGRYTSWENREAFDYSSDDEKDCILQHYNVNNGVLWIEFPCENSYAYVICECPA